MRKSYRSSGTPRVRFPEDEGAHPDIQSEWWYGHFNLADSEGREYGAMAAYFNIGIRILAITDLEAGQFYHRVSSTALHPAEGRFELRWGRDHWYRTENDSFSYRFESHGPELGLSLSAASEKPPLLGCGSGVVRWSGGDSYYYSLTRLHAKGQIDVQERTIDVEGMGVMDHQWMASLGRGGWDWFCVQLDNDTEVILWHIVDAGGSVKTRDLTVMFPDSTIHHTRRFALERLDSWLSPESGREYGVAWRVREKACDMDLLIKARYPQQEIRLFEGLSVPTFPFWEGSMAVSGRLEGEAVTGKGYAELVRPPEDAG
jgi:predicted secreted hydrolase